MKCEQCKEKDGKITYKDSAGHMFCGVDCMIAFFKTKRQTEPLQGDPGDETTYLSPLRLDLE